VSIQKRNRFSPEGDAAALPPPPVAAASGATVTTVAAVLALTAAAALRIVLLFRYRIDSDETQHLHVVWGWSHGLLQYRDLLDNHMPLFHILSVPLLRLAGERPAALLLGRMAMLPLFAVMALLTYRIGMSCYPRRAVIGAVVIGMLAPDFFLCSIEYRPDVLWATLWLATLAVLVTGRLTARRAAAAGLLLGLALAVSAKTSLLAAAIGIAAVAALAVTHELPLRLGDGAKRAASFAAAALVAPSLVAGYFAARGAWKPFLACTVGNNLVPWRHPIRLLLLPLLIVAIFRVTRRIARDDGIPPAVRRRRIFLFVAAYSYVGALVSLWPIVETEHWLPFYPLAAVVTIPLLPRSERVTSHLALAVLACELFWIVRVGAPWRNQVIPTTTVIQQAMALTAPNEDVLDLKGEIVFRPRAFPYVLEKITKHAIAVGRLRDTIAADVLATRTMVAVSDNPGFPGQGRDFLRRNFVNVGCLRVAGVLVPGSRTFRIGVPGEYSVVSARAGFRGTLDGTPYSGPRFLATGVHTLASSAPSVPAAVIWSRAAALGFSPFVREARCDADVLRPLTVGHETHTSDGFPRTRGGFHAFPQFIRGYAVAQTPSAVQHPFADAVSGRLFCSTTKASHSLPSGSCTHVLSCVA
jgi:hypothetical protein